MSSLRMRSSTFRAVRRSATEAGQGGHEEAGGQPENLLGEAVQR